MIVEQASTIPLLSAYSDNDDDGSRAAYPVSLARTGLLARIRCAGSNPAHGETTSSYLNGLLISKPETLSYDALRARIRATDSWRNWRRPLSVGVHQADR